MSTTTITTITTVDKFRHYFQNLIKEQKRNKETGWQFKIRNYQKIIDNLDEEITSVEDIQQLLKRAGFKSPKSLYQRCIQLFHQEEIINEEKEDTNNLKDELLTIPWVGESTAKKLIEHKVQSLEDLKENFLHLLNRNQKIGLKYYDDLISEGKPRRIKREEIEEFENVIQKFPCQKIITGSYRRKLPTCGDIDLVIRSSSIEDMVEFLKEKYKIITLAQGNIKFMGLVKIRQRYRRLDIVSSPKEEYPFAVLYLTGSKEFNQIFRARANHQGYTLNEHEIKHLNGKKVLQCFETEKDIFDFLGERYIEPEDR